MFNPSKLGSGPVKQRELKDNVATNEKFFEGMQSHLTPIKKHGLLILLLKSHGLSSSNIVGLYVGAIEMVGLKDTVGNKVGKAVVGILEGRKVDGLEDIVGDSEGLEVEGL